MTENQGLALRTSPTPQAAIIIPHYNDTERLHKCLSALAPQLTRHPVEIIVADNGSSVDLTPVQTAFPQVQFVIETEKGAAAARNAGIQASSAPRLFFTDSDCVPAPDWLETALAFPPEDRIIGGRIDLFDETPPPRSGAEAFETVFAFPQQLYVEKKHFSVTANLLATRAMFEDVGGFDGRVVEDHDWCLRARAKGYAIAYHPELRVAHPTRSDWAALARKWRRTTNENYFLNGTGAKDRLRWALRAGIVAASGLIHLPRALTAPQLSAQERLACAGTLLRLRLARTGWMLRQALFGDERVK
ncbi:MAG: glycosyltransferase family 2 protein [Qingshengfaniella sp.]